LIHKTAHEGDAAKQAFAEFLSGRTLTANQIESIDLIINYLTGHGAMETDRLYELPFTDFNPLGVEGLFRATEVTELFTVLSQIRARAADHPATDLWLRSQKPTNASLTMASIAATSSSRSFSNSPSRRLFDSVPLFYQMNMTRFSSRRSGVSTVSMMRRIPSS
jgi:EcoEI R protein C-terminal